MSGVHLPPRGSQAFSAAPQCAWTIGHHAPEHYSSFCTLMWAGLRPGGGFALTAEEIDVKRRSVLVDAEVGQYGGPGTAPGA